MAWQRTWNRREWAMDGLQDKVARLTRRLVEDEAANGRVRSAVVAVDWEGRGRAAAAVGVARADSGAPMTVRTPFHIASVGKPMTAALIFQAVEENRLGAEGVDARLIETGALPAEVCRRLHRMGGTSFGEAITLRHLLTHTSGLRDAQIDDGQTTAEGYGGRYAPGSIVGSRIEDERAHLAAVAAGLVPSPALKTRKLWRPWDPERVDERDAGLVNFYLNGGMAEHALFRPGEGFHYSDTAFTILGLVAEHLLGAGYATLLRERLFAPLGMTGSYLDGYGERPDPPGQSGVSDCWAGDVPLVSSGVTLSNDWGGGGQVCTAEDLLLFIKGLSGGAVFRHEATWREMTRWCTPRGRNPNYVRVGCGIFTYASDAGLEIIGHSGAWGGRMFWLPALGMALAGTVNRSAARTAWMVEIAEALAAS